MSASAPARIASAAADGFRDQPVEGGELDRRAPCRRHWRSSLSSPASSVVVKRMALAMVWRWMKRPFASSVPFMIAWWLAVTSMQ